MYLAVRHWSAHAVLGCFTSLKRAKRAIEDEVVTLIANVKIQSYQFEYYILYAVPNEKVGGGPKDHIIIRRYILTKTGGNPYTRWSKVRREAASSATPAATLREFAYAILEGDPVACDAVRDILKI